MLQGNARESLVSFLSISEAGICDSLRTAVEILRGKIIDQRARAADLEKNWREVRANARTLFFGMAPVRGVA